MEAVTIEALQNGDHKAFEEIFLIYFDKVKCFLSGFLKSESEAEELAQDIFVKLWINRQSLNPQKPFNTYIFTIARNTALNYLKHKLVEEKFKSSYSSDDYELTSSSDEILFAKEINLLVEMALSKMSFQRRRIYQMSRNEGCSNEEIALQLGISKRTVENQLSLTIKELKDIILTFWFLVLVKLIINA